MKTYNTSTRTATVGAFSWVLITWSVDNDGRPEVPKSDDIGWLAVNTGPQCPTTRRSSCVLFNKKRMCSSAHAATMACELNHPFSRNRVPLASTSSFWAVKNENKTQAREMLNTLNECGQWLQCVRVWMTKVLKWQFNVIPCQIHVSPFPYFGFSLTVFLQQEEPLLSHCVGADVVMFICSMHACFFTCSVFTYVGLDKPTSLLSQWHHCPAEHDKATSCRERLPTFPAALFIFFLQAGSKWRFLVLWITLFCPFELYDSWDWQWFSLWRCIVCFHFHSIHSSHSGQFSAHMYIHTGELCQSKKRKSVLI